MVLLVCAKGGQRVTYLSGMLVRFPALAVMVMVRLITLVLFSIALPGSALAALTKIELGLRSFPRSHRLGPRHGRLMSSLSRRPRARIVGPLFL